MAKNYRSEVDAALKELDFENKTYQVVVETSEGPITLDLLYDAAPGHVKNFCGLAKAGFYDGGGFHRVIGDFMIQGGCPEGTGTGGPGYTIPAEFNATPHVPGVLSMARSASPNSAGSQFFICTGRHGHLDGQYTAFGRTADDASLEVVKKIGAVPTDAGDKPRKKVELRSARVVEKS